MADVAGSSGAGGSGSGAGGAGGSRPSASVEKRNERRRRRIQRRTAILNGASSFLASRPPGPAVGGDGAGTSQAGGSRVPPQTSGGITLTIPTRIPLQLPEAAVQVARGYAVPIVGAVAMAGRQRDMEDALTIRTNLCTPWINGFRPVHYFAVFDGHGGAHFALICKMKMHAILEEGLRRERPISSTRNGASSSRAALPPVPPSGPNDESVIQESWRVLLTRCFRRTEMVGMNTCRCGSVGFQCGCHPRSSVGYSGTTATVVVLTEKHIVVGNCGDSRAILYRRGRIIPLSFDHKPDRADEKARIEALGGRVIFTDTARVEGILAMSRAIGNGYLKPYVTSEPEVTFTRRDNEDDFLIVATDGIWDVIPVDMACRVVRGCFKKPPSMAGGAEIPEDMVYPSRSACAATLLSRLAVARRTTDSVGVIVVDMKRATINVDGDNNVILIN